MTTSNSPDLPAFVESDYLVIGAGAMGMAFVDTILAETTATVTLVDRHHRPGGHWTLAYPFVRLHQPSAFYGVNSTALGQDRIDQSGWNQGLYELASSSEVCTYFEQLLQHHFLPSGRVTWLPGHDYNGDRLGLSQLTNRVTGAVVEAGCRAQRVDATYMGVSVPAMRPPPYRVAEGVSCVPVNGLAGLQPGHSDFTVIGAGKTGMDACLYLLAQGLDPDRITWIMPRDSWILDRKNIQPGALTPNTLASFARQQEAAALARDIPDLFARLEASGDLMRIDPAVTPSMYRCATITSAELEQLRRIRNIVRLGRVQVIERQRLLLEQGEVACRPETLHIDCSADGLARRPELPVFNDSLITLQSVRTCQQVFSAAFIAHVTASNYSEAERNQLCSVVPHPDSATDYLRSSLQNTLNQVTWAQDEPLQQWLMAARLDGFAGLAKAMQGPATAPPELLRSAEFIAPAVANLQKLLAAAGT